MILECACRNLFRFKPDLKKKGKNPFTLNSKAPTGGYQEFLMNEARFSALTRSFPYRTKELFALNEVTAKKRYDKFTRLQTIVWRGVKKQPGSRAFARLLT